MCHNPPILQLHHPEDNRFALRFITNEKAKRAEKARQLTEDSDIELAIIDETVGGQAVHLLYARTHPGAAYLDFEGEEDVIEWINEHFSQDDKQVLYAVIDIFDGILTEKEDQDAGFSTYKEMDLEEIPNILNRVEWRQLVPDVGAELLSYFILVHPMPNTNHRTGIGLLNRYLTSYDDNFTMPDTGEEGQWYQWCRKYIYDSKRLLTLRNQLRLLYWANRYGYEHAERKEGIQINLTALDFEREDHRRHYANRHLDRSREFVDTALEEGGSVHLREKSDDGKRAFVDRLRGGE